MRAVIPALAIASARLITLPSAGAVPMPIDASEEALVLDGEIAYAVVGHGQFLALYLESNGCDGLQIDETACGGADDHVAGRSDCTEEDETNPIMRDYASLCHGAYGIAQHQRVLVQLLISPWLAAIESL